MKINPSQIAKAMEIYKSQKPSTVGKDNKDKAEKDELVLSNEAQAFQIALKAAKEKDSVDLAKVESIKKRMEAGVYKVDSRQIAEKMVDDILGKKKI